MTIDDTKRDAAEVQRPTREVLFRETTDVHLPLGKSGLDALRSGFSALFDRAARAAQLAGFEQDDTVVDRFLIVRTRSGGEFTLEAGSLADADALAARIVEACDGPSESTPHSEIEIVGLQVVAWLERWP